LDLLRVIKTARKFASSVVPGIVVSDFIRGGVFSGPIS